jgi:hypothetical protein
VSTSRWVALSHQLFFSSTLQYAGSFGRSLLNLHAVGALVEMRRKKINTVRNRMLVGLRGRGGELGN